MAFMCCSWFKMDKSTRPLSNTSMAAKWMKCFVCWKTKECYAGVGGDQTDGPNHRGAVEGRSHQLTSRKLPIVSKNGFTVKMAQKYVKALRETVDFAKKDNVICGVLNSESIIIPDFNLMNGDLSMHVQSRPVTEQSEHSTANHHSPSPQPDEESAIAVDEVDSGLPQNKTVVIEVIEEATEQT